MKYIIDIETIPDIDVYAEAQSAKIEAPANYKDADKIAQYIEQKKAAIIDDIVKQASLSRAYGKICCVGLMDVETKETMALTGEESKILTDLNKVLQNCRKVITYNGTDFDIPFINVRMAINGIESPLEGQTSIYHVDLYKKLVGYRPVTGVLSHGLKAISERFGYPKTDEDLDGSWVFAMYEAGKINEIAQYCLQDCERTYHIAKVLGEVK